MQVILAMWDLLVFGGPDHDSAWDELHDAGVAHLMFTAASLSLFEGQKFCNLVTGCPVILEESHWSVP